MKFFHLSDLHIGKQLNGWSLRENQEQALVQVADYAKEHKPDAILICGDIYDKSIPSGEAFAMFGQFLERLSETGIPALIIAGNHDSPERLGFAGPFLEKGNIFLSAFPPSKEGEHLKKVVLSDSWGKVNFYLFPFMKPGYVRALLEAEDGGVGESAEGETANGQSEGVSAEKAANGQGAGEGTEGAGEAANGQEAGESAEGAGEGQSAAAEQGGSRSRPFKTYDGAFRAMIAREEIDVSERNVILCHQFFVSGQEPPETCESETAVLTAGGLDQIDVSALDPFDYAALGHLHGSQRVGRESARYCGTPYKYSVSEERHKKAVVMVELKEKGEEPELTFLPLSGKQDVRRIRGTLREVVEQAVRPSCHDFVSITLTDEREPANFREQLRETYDHILEIRIDNERTRESLKDEEETGEALSPMEAFERFFELMQRSRMTEEERLLMERVIEEAKEEDD